MIEISRKEEVMKAIHALAAIAVLCLSTAPVLAQTETVAAVTSYACLCTCTAGNTSAEQYYEPAANALCDPLNNGACVVQNKRGTLSNCVVAPRPIKNTTDALTADAIAPALAEFLAQLGSPATAER
jgi:hypothetical protein